MVQSYLVNFGLAHLQHPGPGADGLRFNIEHMSKYPSINVFWVSMLRPMVNLENADTLKHLLKCSGKTHCILTLCLLGNILHAFFAVY